MDVPKLRAELTRFVDMTALVQPPPSPGWVDFTDSRRTAASHDEVVPAAQVVEQILDRVIPPWRTQIDIDKTRRWQQHRQAAQRAIAQLDRQADVQAMLGDDAPTLSAGGFHPWIWQGARGMWSSGHYRQAVVDAAKKVNAELQNIMGTRATAETDLVNMAFSDSAATTSQPRLRPPGDDDGKSAKSLRRGIRAFAEGCYAGLRNPAAHDLAESELNEGEALEQLAAFSVLARWISTANKVPA